jgi:protein involved in temperature-dependent protein secretion
VIRRAWGQHLNTRTLNDGVPSLYLPTVYQRDYEKDLPSRLGKVTWRERDGFDSAQ